MGIVDRNNAINVIDENGNDISVIYINGVPFKGVSRDSSLGWEEFVWAEEPTRSNTFAFENMDDIDVGLVAQCQVNFKYFNIQDFIKFREAIKQRYFRCTFFNVDTGEWEVNREMYCSKSERQKLYYFNPKLIGVLDFTITLVATNRDVVDKQSSTVTITYDSNSGSGQLISRTTIYEGVEENGKVVTKPKTQIGPMPDNKDYVKWGEQYYTNDGEGFVKVGYALKSWNTHADGSGWTYFPTQSFTAFKDLTLYAIWG